MVNNNKQLVIGLVGLGRLATSFLTNQPKLLQGARLVSRILVRNQAKAAKTLGDLGQGYERIDLTTNMEEFVREVDIIVYASSADPNSCLLLANEHLKPSIIATTGFTLTCQPAVPIIYESNFSLGINIIKKMLAAVPKNYLENAGIIDIHHSLKRDKPSGTAKSLAALLNLEHDKIASMRIGNVSGGHELLFDLGQEILSLKHTALNHEAYARGMWLAVEWLAVEWLSVEWLSARGTALNCLSKPTTKLEARIYNMLDVLKGC